VVATQVKSLIVSPLQFREKKTTSISMTVILGNEEIVLFYDAPREVSSNIS
jgi:hypothetical protein